MQHRSTHRPIKEASEDKNVQIERNDITGNIISFAEEKRKRGNQYEAPFSELIKRTPAGEKTQFEKERDHLLSEMIFLKNRDASRQHSSDRMEACDLIAIEKFPLEKILAATDPKENARLYDEISILRTIYVNQLITLDHLDLHGFEEQRGLARIELIRFLLRKTDLCYRKGIILNDINLDDQFLGDTELRIDKIKNDIRQLFEEACDVGKRDPDLLQEFKEDISLLASLKPEQVTLPDKAPELYKDREKREIDGILRKKKPDEFIREVYKQWLGKGLLRPHIKKLDMPLYQALYKHGIPNDFNQLLPKASGKTLRNQNVSAEKQLEQQRALARERSKRLYHKRKTMT